MRDQDPYGLYARLRAAGPVTWDEGLRAWLVTGHDACAVVERREDLFGPGMGTLRGAVEITGRRSVLTMEGAGPRRAPPVPGPGHGAARDRAAAAVHPRAGRGAAGRGRARGRRRAVGALRLAAARGRRGARAGPGARPRDAGAQQGLDGGGARLAAHVRRGSRDRRGGHGRRAGERAGPAADGPRAPRRARRRPHLRALARRPDDPPGLERGGRARPVPRALRGRLRDDVAPDRHVRRAAGAPTRPWSGACAPRTAP